MTYSVVSCPKCRAFQVTTSEKALRCVACGRQTVLGRVRETGCFYGSYKHPGEASERCRALKWSVRGLPRIKDEAFVREGDENRPL
jgi:hypothetical protein